MFHEPPIGVLCGKGQVFAEDSLILEGNFQLQFDINSTNIVKIIVTTTGEHAYDFLVDKTPHIVSFQGTTPDGRRLQTNRAFVVEKKIRSEQGSFILVPVSPVDIGYPITTRSYYFYMPNLTFTGSVFVRFRKSPWQYSYQRDSIKIRLALKEQEYEFFLRQFVEKESIKWRIENALTAVLRIRRKGLCSIDFVEASQLADAFLLLCSLGCGQRVAWVVATDQRGEFIRIRTGTVVNLKAIPQGILGGGELVVGEQGKVIQPLSHFIEQCLPQYYGLTKSKQEVLKEVIWLHCEALERFWSPASIALIARGWELLGREFVDWGKENDNVKLLQNKLCKSIEKSIRELEENNHNIHLHISKKQIKKCVSKLFEPTFKDMLEMLFLQYIPECFSSEFVKDLRDLRGKAVHFGQLTREDFETWLRSVSLQGRVITRILGYSGPCKDLLSGNWG